MIRIRKIPFNVQIAVPVVSERQFSVPSYYGAMIDETYFETGGRVLLDDSWSKYQISHQYGRRIFDHLMLARSKDRPIGQFPMYPILTLIHPSDEHHGPAISLLHRRGIETVHSILEKRRVRASFLLEFVIEQLRRQLNGMCYGPSTFGDSVGDILDKCLSDMQYCSNENGPDIAASIAGMVQELNDLHYSGIRHSEFPLTPLVEEVLSPLSPFIPAEMTEHEIASHLLTHPVLKPKDWVRLLKDPVTIDETAEMDSLLRERLQIADFGNMDDGDIEFMLTQYPEFVELYKLFLESGFTNVYLEYIFQTDKDKPGYLSWVPLKSIEIVNEHKTQFLPPNENITNLLHSIEDILLGGNYLIDLYLDLEGIFDVPDEMMMEPIQRIEIIVRDYAACVTVYCDTISCTAYFDFVVMALISNSFVFN